ncbi:hypothetical protein ABT160_01715 [Streptomyces sp. NPDC001941]|uniref:hypothetical protein n=1 Tax=Streptomyces sp. NPDC001941 TaxID=3154659 RepID=UPI003331528F
MSRAAALASTTVLALTAATGCVTVHGERELLPSATRAEAARALADFTTAYNEADKAFDPALDRDRVTGALGAINQAGLRARSVTTPGGNRQHRPLELTDAEFAIPRKAGWPRWFFANADSNRDTDRGAGDNRWAMVFVKTAAAQPWKVAYLTILEPDEIPAFATDAQGYAVPVAPDSGLLAVEPGNLSEEYAGYLRDGKPDHFKAGQHTTRWREDRRKQAVRPGLATQYVDQALDTGAFAPLGLMTRDGGGFVFFATRYYDRQTAARGYRPKVSQDVRALMTGEVTNTLTKEWVSNQTVWVKPAGAAKDAVDIVGRLQGVVGASGS